MQITAVPQDTRPPRVLVTVTDAPDGGFLSAYRIADQTRTLVRGMVDRLPSGGALTGWDIEMPLNRQYSYVVVHTASDGKTTEAYTQPLLTEASRPWLIDPIQAIGMQVDIQTWPSRTRKARRRIIDIPGNPYPSVMRDLHVAPESEVVFLTRADGELNSLLELLTETTSTLFIRPTGGAVSPAYLSIGDVSEDRVKEYDQNSWARLVPVGVQEVAAPPATIPAHGDTLMDLHQYVGGEGSTLQDLVDTFGPGATLLDIARTQLQVSG